MRGVAPADIAIAADNMWKMSLLARVLERADRAHVAVLVLKGAAFLGWLYRLDERPMADVDLLIHPADRSRFIDALRPDARVLEPRSVGILPAYEPGQFSVDFEGLLLDVHLHVLNSPWLRQLVPIDERGLWGRAFHGDIAGQRALRLSVEDQLLHLAAHATFHHADWTSAHPHRIRDAARLIGEASVDWDLLGDLARTQRMETATWLLLSNPALASVVPPVILRSLKPSLFGALRIRLAARLAQRGDRSLGPILLTDGNLGLFRAFATILRPSPDWLQGTYARVPTRAGRSLRHYLRVASYVIEKSRPAIAGNLPRVATGPRRRSIPAKLWLVLHISSLFFLVHLELRRHPLPKVVARLARTSARRETIAPRLLGQIVVRVLRVGPYQPRCLIMALVHFRMLAEQGQPAKFVIGLPATAVSKDAHAWIEIGGADVGPPPGRGDHVALAYYS